MGKRYAPRRGLRHGVLVVPIVMLVLLCAAIADASYASGQDSLNCPKEEQLPSAGPGAACVSPEAWGAVGVLEGRGVEYRRDDGFMGRVIVETVEEIGLSRSRPILQQAALNILSAVKNLTHDGHVEIVSLDFDAAFPGGQRLSYRAKPLGVPFVFVSTVLVVRDDIVIEFSTWRPVSAPSQADMAAHSEFVTAIVSEPPSLGG